MDIFECNASKLYVAPAAAIDSGLVQINRSYSDGLLAASVFLFILAFAATLRLVWGVGIAMISVAEQEQREIAARKLDVSASSGLSREGRSLVDEDVRSEVATTTENPLRHANRPAPAVPIPVLNSAQCLTTFPSRNIPEIDGIQYPESVFIDNPLMQCHSTVGAKLGPAPRPSIAPLAPFRTPPRASKSGTRRATRVTKGCEGDCQSECQICHSASAESFRRATLSLSAALDDARPDIARRWCSALCDTLRGGALLPKSALISAIAPISALLTAYTLESEVVTSSCEALRYCVARLIDLHVSTAVRPSRKALRQPGHPKPQSFFQELKDQVKGTNPRSHVKMHWR